MTRICNSYKNLKNPKKNRKQPRQRIKEVAAKFSFAGGVHDTIQLQFKKRVTMDEKI